MYIRVRCRPGDVTAVWYYEKIDMIIDSSVSGSSTYYLPQLEELMHVLLTYFKINH